MPASVPEVEEVLRLLALVRLTNIPGKSVKTGPNPPGSTVKMTLGRGVIEVRSPTHAALPRRAGPLLRSAFDVDALGTWLLFPSTGPADGERFWLDGAYGEFATWLRWASREPEGVTPIEGDQETVTLGIAGHREKSGRASLCPQTVGASFDEPLKAVASRIDEAWERWGWM